MSIPHLFHQLFYLLYISGIDVSSGVHALCYLVQIVADFLFLLTEMLMKAGVSKEIAEQAACRIEHCISDESFGKLKKTFEQ